MFNNNIYKTAVFFLGLLIFSSSCVGNTTFSEKRLLMDTLVEIKVVSFDKTTAQKAINLAFNRIKKLEARLNKFDDKSELSKLNAASKDEPIKVSDELFYCIKKALEFSRISNGAFDVTVEPLMKLWRNAEDKKTLPSDSEIKDALFRIGYSNIKLDDKNKTISFLKPDIRIDLGGILKGYAADEAIGVLKEQGITQALVNIGGNIYCLGKKPDKKYWSLGLQHPKVKDEVIGSIKLEDQAISTSGSYERFVRINEKQFSHIINPKTGFPVEGLLSVTVISNLAIDADALSTAIFVLGKEKGREFVNRLKNIEAVMISPGEADEEFDIWVSNGIRSKVKISKTNYNRLW